MAKSNPQAETSAELVDQLAAAEENGDADPSIADLKSDLDKLAAHARRPAPADEFEQEEALQRGMSSIGSIGKNSGNTIGKSVGNMKKPEAPKAAKKQEQTLGQIGPYQLIKKLGEGNVGTVYKAVDTTSQREVALKVLSSDKTKNESAVNRYLVEMESIGKLDHPNIVQAIDVGEADGVHYIAMELVKGWDLLMLAKDPLPVPDACELIRQTADGLQHVHEYFMMHRGIKPSNLRLTKQGEVKILDMGLAQLNSLSSERSDLKASDQLKESIAFMAPEQAANSRNIDIRADIYSMGATLFKLLTSKSPLEHRKYNSVDEMISGVVKDPVPSVAKRRRRLPPELVEIVDSMLAKKPDDRPSEPFEVAELLAPFAVGCRLKVLKQAEQARPTPAFTPQQPVEVSDFADDDDDDDDQTIEDMYEEAQHDASQYEPTQYDELPEEVIAAERARKSRKRLFVLVSACVVLALCAFAVLKIMIGSSESDIGGKFNLALMLFGTKSYVEIPTIERNSDIALTIEAFATPSKVESGVIFKVYGSPGGAVYLHKGKWCGVAGTREKQFAFSAVADAVSRKRQHVALVVTKESLQFYVDGQPVVQESLDTQNKWNPQDSKAAMLVGFDSASPGSHFNGAIDELRVSSIVRYKARFKPKSKLFPDENTLALYHFDEIREGKLIDSSRNKFHATNFDCDLVNGLLVYPPQRHPISTSEREFEPWLSDDGLAMVYQITGSQMGDLWQAKRDNAAAAFGDRTTLSPGLNTLSNETAPTLSADGLVLIFASDRIGSLGGLDLWMCSRESPDEPFGEPANLGPDVNSNVADSSPMLSADGLTLIFASSRGGGMGNDDLWICRREDRDVAFGQSRIIEAVNTPHTEFSPQLSRSGLMLFFTSDRPRGIGGQDIWVSRRATPFEPFGIPFNLGPTVNTVSNESGAALTSDGTLLFDTDFNLPDGMRDIWMTKIIIH